MSKNYNILVSSSKPSKPATNEYSEKQILTLLKLVSRLVQTLKSPEPFSEHLLDIRDNLNYFQKQLGESPSDQIKSELNSIYQQVTCSLCSSGLSSTQLSCGHLFCDACIEKILASSANLACPQCESIFSPYEISAEFARSYFQKLSINSTSDCVTCGKPALGQVACGHHCSLCVSRKYWKNERSCEKCGDKLETIEEVFSLMTQCQGCRCFVYTIGDYAFSVPRHGAFCLKCLKDMKESKRCKSCSEFLSETETSALVSFLFSVCTICKSSKSVENFIPKSCCSDLICLQCQHDSTLCKSCSNLLDTRSLNLLHNFYLSNV